MTGRARAVTAVVGLWVVAIIIAIAAGPLQRPPTFHSYADHRNWLGVARAGDVLSNLGFVLVALLAAGRLRRDGTRTNRALVIAAIVGVGLIGVGSGVYHLAPSDARLAFDWAPIGTALALLSGAVVADRAGPRAGITVAVVGVAVAVGGVAVWYFGGGTAGGDMRGYVVAQGVGVILPVVVALVAPGRVPRWPLFAALGCFLLARAFQAHDTWWLERVGLGGHALKHVAASVAAAFALRALLANRRRKT